jgi:hypothetical protein
MLAGEVYFSGRKALYMSLYGELKRRNVFRGAIAYLALAWLLTEVADTLLPAFDIPDWPLRFVALILALGFVPAFVLSWIYELAPEGANLQGRKRT